MPFVEIDNLVGGNSKVDKYEILYLDQSNKKEWNECVINSEFGYIYDFYEMLMESEYEQSINLTFSIKDVEKNHIVLVMPIYYRKSIYLYNQDGDKYDLYCRYGPVIRSGLSKNEKKQVKKIFLQNLEKQLITYNQTGLFVELAALCPYAFSNHDTINPLIFWGFEPRIRYTWIIDMSNDESILFNNLNRTTQKSMKRIFSESKVYIRESTSESIDLDFEKFLALSEQTYHRNGIMVKSRKYYWNQFYSISDENRKIYFLERYDDGVTEAAAMVHLYQNTARITWVVSANDKEKDVVKFLIFQVIVKLKLAGLKYVEIGGAYPYLPTTDKRRGISDFKQSFGGYLHPIYMGYFTI